MYLGIDLGTSSIKALLLDESQKIIAASDAALTVSRPQHGFSEQQPAHWIAACEQAIAGLKQSHPAQLSAVRGIGLSGQMHGATLLDSADNVLRPCILWNDTRSHEQASRLNANAEFESITGNITFAGFTAPKLVWCKDNEPDIFDRVAKVLLPKDYLRLWLTGEYVSEMSDASGTAWLDVAKRAWSPTLLAACDLGIEHMPALVEGSAVSGQLRSGLAAKWGMSGAVAVAGGAGDNAASACGVGCITDGAGFVSLGTSGVLFASNPRFMPNPQSAVHAFCHAVPDQWHQMGVILSATDSLNWFSNIVGQSVPDLTAKLGDELAQPQSELFLPYLSGERTPHNDAHPRGTFSGLSITSTTESMTRAIIDGVSFAFRDNLQALTQAGTALNRVTALGGGSRSRYWLKSLATALNMPVEVPADGDFGAAFGAARLGLIASERADPKAICQPPAIDHSIEPDPELISAYADAWQRYRALYPAVKTAARKD